MSGLDITPFLERGRQLIQGYGDGSFRISGQRFAGSRIVFRDRSVAWTVTHVPDITMPSLAAVLDADDAVRILLMGCGRSGSLPIPAIGDAFRRHGVVVEWMDTGAACRTFNVLVSEDREVAAALIAVD